MVVGDRETLRADFAARLLEEALANGGRVGLAALLDCVLSVREMRELAKEFGLSPKGGFRLEKASAKVLTPLLADPELPDVIGASCERIAQTLVAETVAQTKAPGPDLAPVLALREQELERARADRDKARAVAQGLRDRVAELTREVAVERDRTTRLTKAVDDLQAQLSAQPVVTGAPRDQSVRIQALQKELEEQAQIELQHRLRQAEHAAELRVRDERIAEIEALIPKSRLKKKKPLPTPTREAAERFVVPHFPPSFFKSLEGRDRRTIEQIYRAVFLFCTEGSRYPGLQVKSLEATTLWSFRAALSLRVYFVRRTDGDVDILEAGDREEQETLLRRYRDKEPS